MAKVYLGDKFSTLDIAQVCYLLATARPSLDLRCIIPEGFGLHPDYFPTGRSSYRVPKEFQHDAPFTNMEVVIEAGAIIYGAEAPESLANSGLNVVCMPGNF
jgi:hypothetical protein